MNKVKQEIKTKQNKTDPIIQPAVLSKWCQPIKANDLKSFVLEAEKDASTSFEPRPTTKDKCEACLLQLFDINVKYFTSFQTRFMTEISKKNESKTSVVGKLMNEKLSTANHIAASSEFKQTVKKEITKSKKIIKEEQEEEIDLIIPVFKVTSTIVPVPGSTLVKPEPLPEPVSSPKPKPQVLLSFDDDDFFNDDSTVTFETHTVQESKENDSTEDEDDEDDADYSSEDMQQLKALVKDLHVSVSALHGKNINTISLLENIQSHMQTVQSHLQTLEAKNSLYEKEISILKIKYDNIARQLSDLSKTNLKSISTPGPVAPPVPTVPPCSPGPILSLKRDREISNTNNINNNNYVCNTNETNNMDKNKKPRKELYSLNSTFPSAGITTTIMFSMARHLSLLPATSAYYARIKLAYPNASFDNHRPLFKAKHWMNKQYHQLRYRFFNDVDNYCIALRRRCQEIKKLQHGTSTLLQLHLHNITEMSMLQWLQADTQMVNRICTVQANTISLSDYKSMWEVTNFNGVVAEHPTIQKYTHQIVEFRMSVLVEKHYCGKFNINWNLYRTTQIINNAVSLLDEITAGILVSELDNLIFPQGNHS